MINFTLWSQPRHCVSIRALNEKNKPLLSDQFDEEREMCFEDAYDLKMDNLCTIQWQLEIQPEVETKSKFLRMLNRRERCCQILGECNSLRAWFYLGFKTQFSYSVFHIVFFKVFFFYKSRPVD